MWIYCNGCMYKQLIRYIIESLISCQDLCLRPPSVSSRRQRATAHILRLQRIFPHSSHFQYSGLTFPSHSWRNASPFLSPSDRASMRCWYLRASHCCIRRPISYRSCADAIPRGAPTRHPCKKIAVSMLRANPKNFMELISMFQVAWY